MSLSEESILSFGVIGMTSSCNVYSLPDTDRSVPGEYGGQEVDPRASWAQISTRPSIELFGDAKELVGSYIVHISKYFRRSLQTYRRAATPSPGPSLTSGATEEKYKPWGKLLGYIGSACSHLIASDTCRISFRTVRASSPFRSTLGDHDHDHDHAAIKTKGIAVEEYRQL